MCALLDYDFQYIDREKQVQTTCTMIVYSHKGNRFEFDAYSKTIDAAIHDAQDKYCKISVDALRLETKRLLEHRN